MTAGRPVPSTPTESRADRIRRLSVLVARASTELQDLLALEHRAQSTRDTVLASVPPELRSDFEPSTAPSSVIRPWAVARGLIRPGMRGRLSNDVRIAYAAAGEPA
jgi:hypothetical protein